MRRLIAGIAAALVLAVAIAAPAAAWTVAASCDHITFAHVPVGASATLTPGPITIAPPNSTTSINGTYDVPPATYQIVFSNGSVFHATVPACPSGSPPPSPSPSSSPGSSPSPNSSPTPSPSHGTPAPSPSRSGGILGSTATPRRTAPATDTLAGPTSNGLSASLPLLVSLLIGINIGLVLILRSLDRPHGRTRRG